MAWVAVNSAVNDIEEFGLEGPIDKWKALREEIHTEVLEKGFDPERNTFTQYYGSQELDASVLMIPLVGFLPPNDSRVDRDSGGDPAGAHGRRLRHALRLATFRARRRALRSRRRLPRLLVLDGRRPPSDRAHRRSRELFEKLLSLRNDLGLLSEEYDPVAGGSWATFPRRSRTSRSSTPPSGWL